MDKLREIDKYHPGESEIDGEKKIIKLSSNESPFKIPINVIKKIVVYKKGPVF